MATGIVLFAVGILFSIAWHELGHMWAARATGMRVRRYFVGFGPTLWSVTRPYKGRSGGQTEYGLKAIPLGGFVDIAGMTNLDAVSEEERPFAMVNRPAWARVVVLLGGIVLNVVLALAILFGVALKWGLPNTDVVFEPKVADTQCVAASQRSDGRLEQCSGVGPAERAGVLPGDMFVSFNGESTPDFPALTKAVDNVAQQHSQLEAGQELPTPAVVLRDGKQVALQIPVQVVERLNSAGNPFLTTAIGIIAEQPNYEMLQFNPVSAVGGTLDFAGYMVGETVRGIVAIPERVPGLVKSIAGGDRADDSPMSVVGASRIGGELVSVGAWQSFWMMLASLNLFLAGFNLLPLPPLDGGHIVMVLWEKLRDWVRRRRGLAPAGPADYTKLLPLTYAMSALLLAFGLLVITADVVNPISLF